MQFIKNGPNIPERLLQAHEDGQVVIFSGAGISYPAGLPGFDCLVKKLYSGLDMEPNPIEKTAIKNNQFDTTIGLLEDRIIDGRKSVRKALHQILTPNLDVPDAIATHEALLTLAKDSNSRYRLITTNFDRIFEHVIAEKSLPIVRFKAPFLPVPKNRWNGLVYLHGLLPEKPTTDELNCLVISSGDFRIAYLTERWAARFVADLFHNYQVCFVGYSINDPVLRYMMDSLAADRLLGELTPEMFAFGSYSNNKKDQVTNEWKAKNVTPILYKEYKHHTYLHKTLQAWAETYRDGVNGKERIVIKNAMAKPLNSTIEDNFVDKMLWALSDPSALPAKQFAELDPVPTLDWLEPLSVERYKHQDLSKFGITPHSQVDKKLSFSQLRRPTPYKKAPLMALVKTSASVSQLDDVMSQLSRWLLRHLDDPKLFLWLAKQGGQLHDSFSCLIENRLEELESLIRDNKIVELEQIENAAPNAIPSPEMKTLWQVMLAGFIKPDRHNFDFYQWKKRINLQGQLTASLRKQLREILSPKLLVRESIRMSGLSDKTERVSDAIKWEVVLTSEYTHESLKDLAKCPQWQEALPHLMSDFNSLLTDALELKEELGDASRRKDQTYIDQPSISEHPQNRHYHDWTALIDLNRDAWLTTSKIDKHKAHLMAEIWMQTPYPLFKRLAFFAAYPF